MSKMTFTRPRATFEETLEFTNRIREVGGGNPLGALVPAVPQDSKQCLIAKNLNFNCNVDCDEHSVWYMSLDDPDIRDAIAEALELKAEDYKGPPFEHGSPEYRVILPPEIGRVASDFDQYQDLLDDIGYDIMRGLDKETGEVDLSLTESDRQLLETFHPYIEAAENEINGIGVFNDNGELIL